MERALWSSRLLALVAELAGVVLTLETFWVALGRRQLGQVVERHVGVQRISAGSRSAGSRRAQFFSNLPLGVAYQRCRARAHVQQEDPLVFLHLKERLGPA